MPLEEDIETEFSPGERARRQFRIFLANFHCFRLGTETFLQRMRAPPVHHREVAGSRGPALSCLRLRLRQPPSANAHPSELGTEP